MSRSTLTGLNTSSSEREYVALGVELGMRGDGRGRLDYRSLSVQAGVLAQVCCALSLCVSEKNVVGGACFSGFPTPLRKRGSRGQNAHKMHFVA